MMVVLIPKMRGHQDLNGVTEKLIAHVAEHRLSLAIDEDNVAREIDDVRSVAPNSNSA